ncbi:MAG: hypothetical protein AB1778_09760 [Candidatus Bipolaricaulota bacterium]
MKLGADHVLFGLGIAAAAIGLWFFVLAISSWAGGWARLARSHRAPEPPAAGLARWLSGRFGVVSYSGVLAMRVDDLGLTLSAMWMFRPFHPPLFVPWHALQGDEVRSFLTRCVRLRFPDAPGVSAVFCGMSATLLRPYLDRMSRGSRRRP